MPRLSQRFGPRPTVCAARIRALRESRGLTQEDVRRQLGIARGTYRKLETTANPQLSTLVALAEVFGLDVGTIARRLVDGEHQRPP